MKASSLLSPCLRVHLLFCFFLSRGRIQDDVQLLLHHCVCVCSLCALLKSQALTVYTAGLLARDARSSLCVRPMKAKTVVFSSHTKRLDSLSICGAESNVKKKKIQFASFQVDPISADTENRFGLFFPFLTKRKKFFLPRVPVCHCILVCRPQSVSVDRNVFLLMQEVFSITASVRSGNRW